MTLTEDKLKALYDYFVEGGSNLREDVVKAHGIKIDQVDGAIDQLRVAYPNLKEDVAKAKAAREKPAPKAASKITEAFLIRDGVQVELEIFGISGSQIFVKEKIPTDIVVIKIGGNDVSVDLLQLESEAARVGLSVVQLKVLGEVAKGV